MIAFHIVFLFLLMVIILKSFCHNGVAKKIMFIYCIWMFALLLMSTLNLSGMNPVSNECYFLWLLNVSLVIVFVVLLCKGSKFSNRDHEIDEKIMSHVNKILKSKAAFFLLVATTFALLFFLLKYNSLARAASFSELRNIRYSTLFSSNLEYFFFSYILANLVEICAMLLAILIIKKRLINRVAALCLLDIVIYTLIGFGRMTIFSFLCYLVLAYVLFCQNKKIRIRHILIFAACAILLFFISTAIITVRATGFNGLDLSSIIEFGIVEQLNQVAVYFTGGLRLFDSFLLNGFPAITDPTIMRASLGGLDEIIGSANMLIGVNYRTINSDLGVATQSYQNIGNGLEMNAFYTCLMNYYCDLGYLGCVIFPILHAGLITFVIKNLHKRENIFSALLLLFVAKNALFSIIRWNYQFGANFFLLIILYIFSKYKIRLRTKIQ